MTLRDYSLTAFTVLNGARIVAYLPQIICVYRDRAGASSVSMMTWGMFFSANIATVFYALTVSRDTIVAGIFAANAVACIFIFALILRKRITHFLSEKREADHDDTPPIPDPGQFRITALLMNFRQRMEDRIAARHSGNRWSDAIEREINKDWQDYRCGRLH
jgi:hypothetical protein